MPRARHLSNYPPAYWEICERAAIRQDTISHVVSDHRAAQRLQGKFYAFRQAVRRELDLIKLRPTEYEAQHVESVKNLWQWVQVVVCWFDRATPAEAPTTVCFMHRDQTPEARMLQNMLDENPASQAAPTAKVDESLARLQEKLAGLEPDKPTKKYY